jgi:L,D-transpeptidase catalytic domain
MRLLAGGAAALALALMVPAAASAQGSTTTPAPTPTPTPAPAKATLSLRALDTLRDGHRRVVVSGRRFRVEGVLRPYAAGERVRVTILRNGHPVRHLHPRVRRGQGGRAGVFTIKVRRRTTGAYAVRAIHPATPRLSRARARWLRVHVVGVRFGWGRGGAAVRLLQRGLRRMAYHAGRSGVYDAATGRAVLAWRKVTHRARVYMANRDVLLGVLAGQGRWRVRHPRDGHHVEADLSLQVLALVDGRHVERVEHLSSGKPSTPTVLGRFHVYRKTPGTNSHGMVNSSYFIRGYAIHGYAVVPTYNASHGCLRVPIPDARAIYRWIHIGDVVWVEP